MLFRLKPKFFWLLILGLACITALYLIVTRVQGFLPEKEAKAVDPINRVPQQHPKPPEKPDNPLKPDTIIARVGGQTITAQDLHKYITQNTRSVKMAETDAGKIQLLRAMIVELLIEEGMRREGFLPKDQSASQKDLIEAYRLLSVKYFPEINEIPEEEAIRQYYLKHQEDFGIPAMVRIGQIQFRVPSSADAGQREAVRVRAAEVLRRLNAGEAFSDLADQFTENPQGKGAGGDLGFLPINQNPWLRQAVSNLRQGQYSEVIESPVGYEILQLKDQREALPAPYPSVRESVLARMRHEIRRKSSEDYAWRLAKEVGVTIERDEFRAALP